MIERLARLLASSIAMEDAIVCGGGPAGLAAAEWLGRYRRKTVVFDEGQQRNRAARATHGYLTRDGIAPDDLLGAARADLDRYDTVSIVAARATSARQDGEEFVVSTEEGDYRTQRVVLATGVEDACPDIRGFEALYGTSVFHCSCCDGFEACGHRVLAIGWGEHVAGFALDLLEWGATVTLVTDGRRLQGDSYEDPLRRNGIELIEEEIDELTSRDGHMTGAVLAGGRFLPATMAFFSIAHQARVSLAEMLGCRLDGDGYVEVDGDAMTSTEGVYAAGDVTPGEQLIQVAAAQGTIAGIKCAMSLRGVSSASNAPHPGPDPEEELTAS
jgi:thioredoxin reductase